MVLGMLGLAKVSALVVRVAKGEWAAGWIGFLKCFTDLSKSVGVELGVNLAFHLVCLSLCLVVAVKIHA